MDLTDIHHALERLDAVLAAAQAALGEDPALPAAQQAYLEAYAEARSAQGPRHPRVKCCLRHVGRGASVFRGAFSDRTLDSSLSPGVAGRLDGRAQCGGAR